MLIILIPFVDIVSNMVVTLSAFGRCEVGIQELPKQSALGRLRGSDNVVRSLRFSTTLGCYSFFNFYLILDFLSSIHYISYCI